MIASNQYKTYGQIFSYSYDSPCTHFVLAFGNEQAYGYFQWISLGFILFAVQLCFGMHLVIIKIIRVKDDVGRL